MVCHGIGPRQVWSSSWQMLPEPIVTLAGTAVALLHLSWWRQEDQCPRELTHGLTFPRGLLHSRHASSNPLPSPPCWGWQRLKLPLGEQRMSHQKAGNPGEPAESLESPFFDRFIFARPPPHPPSLLCETFQDLSLSTGILAGQPVPKHRQTEGIVLLQSAALGLPGAPRAQVQDYTWVLKENKNSQGK